MVKVTKVERSKTHLVQVATQLFAQRGLRGVTVRDIAAEAGVSHSMIFRHFGGMDGLITASFESLSQQVGRSSKLFEPLPNVGQMHQLLDVLSDNRQLAKMMIHGLLEEDYRFEDPDHLAFKRLVLGLEKKRVAGEFSADIDSQILAISAVAILLGWQLVEPRISDLIGEPDLDVREYRKAVLKMWISAVSQTSG
jgi:AcrR family transcriptional regulator